MRDKYISYQHRDRAHWRVVVTRPGRRPIYLGSYYDIEYARQVRDEFCGVHGYNTDKGSRNKPQGMYD